MAAISSASGEDAGLGVVPASKDLIGAGTGDEENSELNEGFRKFDILTCRKP